MSMIPSVSFDPLVQLLIDYVKKEGALILGVKGEIRRLATRMKMVRKFLIDAERRQFQAELIRAWLDELRDIMYEAQDIIDDFKIEAEKRKKGSSSFSSSSSSSAVLSCSCSPFSFVRKAALKHDIGKRIQSLNQRLDDINKNSADLSLAKIDSRDDDGKTTVTISPITSPLVEPDIVGSAIEEDTKKLVELLTEEHKEKNIVIYAIVGMGGIGKTTLAQKIFNNDTLRTNFQQMKPIWVCVSKHNFDEIRILKSIVNDAGEDPSSAGDKAKLQNLLFEVVGQKRLFLVLDDVWNAQAWDDLLRTPLSGAGTGSRILVTTRDEGIAKEMGATLCHNVAKLSDEDGWSLLQKMVLFDKEEQQVQTLRDVGIQIVKKCDSLPLAIRAIGGLLRRKEARPSEWEKVFRDLAWSFSSAPTRVMGALYLSYEDLPPHLKQCFMYLALFPEDYLFVKEDLTYLWIAEGFVEANDCNLLEEKADEYWNELMERSLLQPTENWKINCKLHDILRDLAQELAGKECRCMNAEFNSEFIPQEKTRRLYINNASMRPFLHQIKEQSSLRTLIGGEEISEEVQNILKHLRILSLRGSSIEQLPNSLLRLLHLRLLDLRKTSIVQIPVSIGSLKYLQFLLLDECRYLQSLPKAIGSLTDLRCLTMGHTKIDRIPKAISRLMHIRRLEPFILSGSTRSEEQGHNTGEWCTLEDLKHLKLLRLLRIPNLERSSSTAEAKAAELINKSHLTDLRLECSDTTTSNEESTARIVQVFEELRPPSSIEFIRLYGYFGNVLPKWLTSSSSLTNLKYLSLEACPRLRSLPYSLLNHATVLEELTISGLDNLEAIESLRHIKKLEIYNSRNLKIVADLPSLKHIKIDLCAGLGKVEHLHQLRTLIIIRGYQQLESFPEWMRAALKEGEWPFPNLQMLQIDDCSYGLLLRCLIGGPDWPIIKDIPRFSARCYGFFAAFIDYTKSPFSFKTNIDDEVRSWPLQVNHPLHEHVLLLTFQRRYFCGKCGEPASSWSFYCNQCCFYLHPKCALQEDKEGRDEISS